ncbi:hypothetical protein ACBI99_10660 [Nonomuraea sp. ATR24]|uniref:hypothetical protein n=1 Tax=Nonomuraea TaxID=83681 RepID=UPI001C5F2AFF|nr:hypothetical protein [Nonomuraea ceibae]
MEDANGSGLIDVSDIDLEDLKSLAIPALDRAWRRCAGQEGGTVAGFSSAL